MDEKYRKVSRALVRLAILDRAGCLELWRKWFGTETPRYLSTVFMRKALAHELQCRKLGRLPASDLRALQTIANGKMPAPALADGTQLVREWNGRTYQVLVTRSGYVMDGRAYGSLTAIARRITGTNWSGPRFFGLVDRRGKHQEKEKPAKKTRHPRVDEQSQGTAQVQPHTKHSNVGTSDSNDSGIVNSDCTGLIGRTLPRIDSSNHG